MSTAAQQGHRYKWQGRDVLALSSGDYPRIAIIRPTALWPLGDGFVVNASSLEPLGMRYLHGEVPG